MSVVIKVENLSKQYRLGEVGTGALAHDLNKWWHKVRGKENPYLKIGETNDRATAGISDYVWALKDVNFEVQQGEVLGIIGRNGAGKSTLLKILSKTTTPTTGSIKVKGRIASLLEVGTGFHPELSGRDNIFLNGAILGMTKQEIKSKFDEIVDFAGVERYIDTPVKRYSSGMYVRLAFGVAAHLEPEILIVDEVLAVGDVEFQKKALGKMKEVSEKGGRTVLFVSHNISAIENLCNRALLMHQGNILYDGKVSETLDKYNLLLKSNSVFGLNKRVDRVGNGKLVVINFYITSLKGEILTSVKSGSDFNLVLEYVNKSFPDTFKSTVASVAFVDSRNQVVFLVRSNFTGENFSVTNKQGKIICTIKDFALANGTYNIISFLGFGETEVYDLVENACEVKVEGGDFFGTGSVGLPFFCKTLSRAHWTTND
jgi:lipopolysaccharide transport system ATP-binding protein